MPKSKNSPALFELLRGKPKADPGVAPWTAGTASRTEQSGVPRVTTDGPRILRDDPGAGDEDAPNPLFEVDGPSLRISLTSKSGAVVVFAALLVILGIYAAGRASGRSQAVADFRASQPTVETSELDEVRSRPPSPHLVSDLVLGAQPATRPAEATTPARPAPADPVAPKGTWTQGLTYIVAQEFNKGQLDDAKRALEFLDQHGVPAAVVPLKSGDIFLITTKGYNRSEAAQKKASDDLLERVRAIGEKYFKAGGRFRLEGYLKKLNADSWQ